MSNRSVNERSQAALRPDGHLLRLPHPAPEFGPTSRAAQSAPAHEVPLCDKCGSTMNYLGLIPPGRLSAGKIVFRCYTCNRVISLPPTA